MFCLPFKNHFILDKSDEPLWTTAIEPTESSWKKVFKKSEIGNWIVWNLPSNFVPITFFLCSTTKNNSYLLRLFYSQYFNQSDTAVLIAFRMSSLLRISRIPVLENADTRAWNQSASFRLTQWLKIIPHMIWSYYRCCCINEPVIFSHLKLGQQFYALLKVCSDHDDIVPLTMLHECF